MLAISKAPINQVSIFGCSSSTELPVDAILEVFRKVSFAELKEYARVSRAYYWVWIRLRPEVIVSEALWATERLHWPSSLKDSSFQPLDVIKEKLQKELFHLYEAREAHRLFVTRLGSAQENSVTALYKRVVLDAFISQDPSVYPSVLLPAFFHAMKSKNQLQKIIQLHKADPQLGDAFMAYVLINNNRKVEDFDVLLEITHKVKHLELAQAAAKALEADYDLSVKYHLFSQDFKHEFAEEVLSLFSERKSQVIEDSKAAKRQLSYWCTPSGKIVLICGAVMTIPIVIVGGAATWLVSSRRERENDPAVIIILYTAPSVIFLCLLCCCLFARSEQKDQQVNFKKKYGYLPV